MADRDAVRVGDRDAEPGPGAANGSGGQLTAQVGVKGTEAAALTGPFGQTEQCGQWEHQVC